MSCCAVILSLFVNVPLNLVNKMIFLKLHLPLMLCQCYRTKMHPFLISWFDVLEKIKTAVILFQFQLIFYFAFHNWTPALSLFLIVLTSKFRDNNNKREVVYYCNRPLYYPQANKNVQLEIMFFFQRTKYNLTVRKSSRNLYLLPW